MALALRQADCGVAAEAVAESRAVAPVAFAVPARRAPSDPYADLGPRDRELLYAKRDWARAVWELLRQERHGRRLYTEATAVAAASSAGLHPLLATCGKLGGSWMNATNYRRTVKALTVNGLPRWDRIALLIPRWSGGRPSLVERNPQFVQDVMALWLNIRQPPMSECWRRVASVWRRDGHRTEDLPPSASIEHYIRTHVSATLIERYRGGAKAYSDSVRGYVRRRHEYEVGDVFCADHRRVDYWARVPDPERPGEFKAARLYCSTIEDVRSRYRVHTILYADQHPNHRIVAEILWNAVLANGCCPPRIFYIDNGRDFRKAGLTEPVRLRTADGAPIIDPHTGAAYEHSVCRELGVVIGDDTQGVGIKLSRGYNGKEKPVEGSFGMDARLFDRFQVAFTGNTSVERARLDGEHYDGDLARLPSVEQARLAYGAWLDDFHNAPTQSRICPAETRATAWTTMRRPTRAPLTRDQLDMAFLIPQALCPVVGHTQAGTGGVRVSGWTYSHADLRRQGLWGKPVMVKLAWSDAAVPHERAGVHPPRVFLFHPDGRFICQAMADGTVAAFAETEEERAELGAQCHVVNAAAAMDGEEFQRLTGRSRMIADPAAVVGRIGGVGQVAHVLVNATPPRPRLAMAAKPEVERARGDDAADLRAALDDVVFGGGETAAGGDDLDRIMEAMA